MRTKFRGRTLDIINHSLETNEFYGEWNHFIIEIFENDKTDYRGRMKYWKDHRFYVVVQNPMGGCIVDGAEASTQSKCLQIAFDNIDSDLFEMESVVANKSNLIDEYGQEMEDDIREVEDWLNQMKY